MPYFLLFIFELLLLFVLSKRLINSLAAILFRITRSRRIAIHMIAIIFLPGTIVHELAHFLFAGAMLVSVGRIDVVPQIEGEQVRLGSVKIGETDPLRRTIVGVAPVIFGLILIFAALYFIRSADEVIWWQVALALYLVFAIGNSMFSSRKDLEGAIGFLLAILLVFITLIAVLSLLNPALLPKLWLWINRFNLEIAVRFFKRADIYLLIPVALNTIIALAGKLFKKLLF